MGGRGRWTSVAGWRCALAVVTMAAAGVGCSSGALDPRGPVARDQLGLFTIAFWIAVGVIVVVLGLLVAALVQRHRDAPSPFRGERFVVVGGLVVPTLILLGLMGVTFAFLAAQRTEGQLRVEVDGYRYWWEVRYPDHDAVTANEIHIPVGVDVEFTLRGPDVIHSFWVPQLGGKADLVPGRETTLVLHASEAGEYRGRCAEYCGLQHANMRVLVIAQEPADFERWVEEQAASAVVSDGAAEAAFERNACAACHTIRGTSANGVLGPDLTHFASRRTIGAVTLPNEPSNVAAWIANPQVFKPGAEMPPIVTFTEEEHQRLVDYLTALR
ncbi:MAG: cytochrome c oxidase subunit II [Actinobacteria bacterium]|nr:cytochrome c oxidase subunit II [Actinomycetota bacterium]